MNQRMNKYEDKIKREYMEAEMMYDNKINQDNYHDNYEIEQSFYHQNTDDSKIDTV